MSSASSRAMTESRRRRGKGVEGSGVQPEGHCLAAQRGGRVHGLGLVRPVGKDDVGVCFREFEDGGPASPWFPPVIRAIVCWLILVLFVAPHVRRAVVPVTQRKNRDIENTRIFPRGGKAQLTRDNLSPCRHGVRRTNPPTTAPARFAATDHRLRSAPAS